MEDFDSTQASISSALVTTTRAVTQIAAEDVAFHRSLDPSLGALLDKQNQKLLGLASRLIGAAAADTEVVRPPTSLRDVDDIEGNWRTVVDVIDSLLERADTSLDEFAGAVRRLSPSAFESAANAKTTNRNSRFAIHSKLQELEKPQLLFQDVPCNEYHGPFVPLLSSKPHALTPLAMQPTVGDSDSRSFYPHPYRFEIEQYQYPATIYDQSPPTMYQPWDTTSATIIDSEDALVEMVQELKQAKEIAIDLEHHDQRSYVGIVCLMQISTREKDWIVDTLKPWRRKLNLLNEVFADPSIIKVLHGAHMDTIWLQRDLGLYIVGLFDTHHAARALGYPGGSLAYLLKRFVNVDAQKQYQTADWRVRPLPSELCDYARSDTHYLLYIFDCMRNELIQQSDFSLPNEEGDKMKRVLNKSVEYALQRYELYPYDENLGQGPMGWYKLLSRTPALLTQEQFAVFRAVHKWRDDVAREQDDSTNWVMPNYNIFAIAREMPLNKANLLGLVQPTTQTVRLRADELLGIILRAKESAPEGPEMADVIARMEPDLPARMPTLEEGNAAQPRALPQNATSASGILLNGNTTADPSIRSGTSTFWGHSFESSVHNAHYSNSALQIPVSIPFPALSSDVFATEPHIVAQVHELPKTPAVEQSQAQQLQTDDSVDSEEIMVLKGLGQKRKRRENAAQPDGMASQNDEVALLDDANDRIAAKAERRKARKLKKRAERTAGIESDPRSTEDETPFDYNAAPSILNPPRETKEEMKARKKKEINPYARAMETQRGLPRIQKEKAGKTMTYG